MKLNWNFLGGGGGGCKTKNLLSRESGYFLELMHMLIQFTLYNMQHTIQYARIPHYKEYAI